MKSRTTCFVSHVRSNNRAFLFTIACIDGPATKKESSPCIYLGSVISGTFFGLFSPLFCSKKLEVKYHKRRKVVGGLWEWRCAGGEVSQRVLSFSGVVVFVKPCALQVFFMQFGRPLWCPRPSYGEVICGTEGEGHTRGGKKREKTS